MTRSKVTREATQKQGYQAKAVHVVKIFLFINIITIIIITKECLCLQERGRTPY